VFIAAAPVVFVLLWSTGFVIARYGTRDAGPLSFLFLRMIAAAVILWVIATLSGAPRLTRHDIRWSAVSGTGMHAIYLGGVFVASDLGLPSGLSALIAGLHPVVTSVLAVLLLGELLHRRQWIGVSLGIMGVSVVVIERMGSSDAIVTTSALVAMAVSVVGMSAGTLVQRAQGTSMPLLRGTAVQYAASAIVLGIGAFAVEGFEVEFTTRMVLSLVWSILVLSLAAILIMLWLLQRHAAVKVSSLFFLTPALSTIEGSILFGERLGVLAIIGLGIALVGVALTTRSASPAVVPAAES
jgi:drug/metabolite transporter (DMT)-like permease